SEGRPTFQVILDPADGQGLNWLYEEAEVLDRRTDADGKLHLVTRLAPEKEPRLRTRFPSARRIA
ncbi:MAG TPA: GTPase HflX, partial [Microvirga sp.]|nr:GTPase HflX [Microvirga sp.]